MWCPRSLADSSWITHSEIRMSGYFRGLGPDKRPSTPESRKAKLAVNRTNKLFREQPKSNFRVGETTLLSLGIPALAFEMRVTRQRGRRSSHSRKRGCTGQYASHTMGVGAAGRQMGNRNRANEFRSLLHQYPPPSHQRTFQTLPISGLAPSRKVSLLFMHCGAGGSSFISAHWQSWACLDDRKCVFVPFPPR